MRSAAVLIAGYLISVPLCFRFSRMVRNRKLGELVLLEAGTALLVAGWLDRGRTEGVIINSAALLGFPLYYALRRRT